MAECTKGRLLDFLKDLNVDLTQFKDLSFDNICEENELQPFLSWLCSSFDSSNVKGSIVPAVECSYKCDILSGIEKIHQAELEKNERHLNRLRLEEEELIKQEKEATAKYSATRKGLIEDVASCRNDLVEKEIENTLKIIQKAEPYLPDLASLRDLDEKVFEVNEKFYREEIVALQEELARDEEEGIKELTGWEKVLEESEAKVQNSISQYRAAVRDVTGVEQIDDAYCQTSTEEIVRGRLRCREKTRLLRRLQLMENLETSYKRYEEVTTNSLAVTTLGHAFVQWLRQRAQSVSSLIDQFIGDVKREADIAEKLVAGCENSDEVDGSPPSVPDEPTSQCLQAYTGLLEQLRQEYQSNTQCWRDLDTVVQHFRNGPSLRFCLVPTELMLLIVDSRKMHNDTYAYLKRLAAEFAEIKKESQSGERSEKGMWVYFLADPHKLAVKYHESFNFTNF